MSCKVIRDTYGNCYIVPEAKPEKSVGGLRFDGRPEVQCWWDRGSNKADEDLIIRQDNGTDRADVITLTQGQVYDLIHALSWAIKAP